MAANKAKPNVEEVKKVRSVGKTEYLKDVAMKYSEARSKRAGVIRALKKAKQSF